MAGLVAGVAFAQRGWSVRIHDRYPSLRIEGFGITLWENGLRVLEGVKAYEAAVAEGNPIFYTAHAQSAKSSQKIAHQSRLFRVSRKFVTQALADEAEKAGAELVFNSTAVAVDPAGALIMEDGRRLEADLVIGADGVNSRVRDSLGLLKKQKTFSDGAMRIIINRPLTDVSDEQSAVSSELWSGRRRVISGLCSPEEHYFALVCADDDEAGKERPVNVETWAKSFPELAHVFEQARDGVDWSRVAWANFQDIRLSSWSKGRVAIIGDAAHAMPPNLGQGGNCAMMTALALAEHVDEASSIEAGLAQWEQIERPLIEHIQNWSSTYQRLTKFPSFLRSVVFWLVANVKPLRAQYMKGANHWPTGAVDRRSARPLPLPRGIKDPHGGAS
jgi:2-polyprenyl-6-methoxyphenol hydroxylase-like FAD-dependent oxidoreductase